MTFAPAVGLSQHRQLRTAVESLAALDGLHLIEHDLDELYQRGPRRVLVHRIRAGNVYIIK